MSFLFQSSFVLPAPYAFILVFLVFKPLCNVFSISCSSSKMAVWELAPRFQRVSRSARLSDSLSMHECSSGEREQRLSEFRGRTKLPSVLCALENTKKMNKKILFYSLLLVFSFLPRHRCSIDLFFWKFRHFCHCSCEAKRNLSFF